MTGPQHVHGVGESSATTHHPPSPSSIAGKCFFKIIFILFFHV